MTEIAVISGSKSDRPVVEKVLRVLAEKGVDHDERVLSAHRNPDELERYIREADAKIFIAVAGLSAALPGFIASRTERPVIGVPVSAKLGGLGSTPARTPPSWP
jgi:5-(carboxyamino)imidazole ribonucleotide mutase